MRDIIIYKTRVRVIRGVSGQGLGRFDASWGIVEGFYFWGVEWKREMRVGMLSANTLEQSIKHDGCGNTNKGG